MRNLTELLRNVEVISNFRYTGDVFISKVRSAWKVEMHHKDLYSNGAVLIQVGEGSSLERALENACHDELDKVQNDQQHDQELIKRLKPSGR